MTCAYHERGVVEQYFYRELEPAERIRLEAHLETCATWLAFPVCWR